VATALQAAGLAAITVGVCFIWWPAGIVVGGACLVIAGLALGVNRA